ncbi:nucleotidyltransferase family protein [Balneolaceae bacterium YR4-1]|uniref:Nucleotidyltransferase family protein n=1 Tax=Halalkalibaculum roseum TaxID=2709311 RepID=A0A6M1T042_9BACT|nr:nucleotidyltransferase family protein [Halalkalibaculum roseum]NGP75465.1 nucleotidyltransferase family protein [Halalkalibaculum roseum]
MSEISNVYIALEWITSILNRLDIPYQVVGGLAAKCYGSTRPLHDIDIYVPTEGMDKLERELEDYLTFGPAHHQDKYWDLVFMKLSFNDQLIEIGDAGNTKYFDSLSQSWIKEVIHFEQSQIIEYEGIRLPVMPKQKLIAYKQRLNRKVDLIDIQEIQP